MVVPTRVPARTRRSSRDIAEVGWGVDCLGHWDSVVLGCECPAGGEPLTWAARAARPFELLTDWSVNKMEDTWM
ncbi:hypothetical protein SAT01_14200 [Sinomonas atrocyanea]|nr:hypothetical protein SAT01_14200 [Sinomonas atrocyanea]GGG76563.1 hypothetical protein GCM10007172_31820 [Sinomonas atrocyanea]